MMQIEVAEMLAMQAMKLPALLAMQAIKLPALPTLSPPLPPAITALPPPYPVILMSMVLVYLLSLPLTFVYFLHITLSQAANKKQINEKQDQPPKLRHIL